MKTLIEITNDQKAVEDLLTEINGDISDQDTEKLIETWIAEITKDLANKSDSYKFRMDSIDKFIEQFKSYSDMFSKQARILKNLSDSLKDRLKMAMIEMNMSEIKGNLFIHKLSATKKSLKIENESNIPKEYFYQTITTSLDKDKLRADLESGKSIPGAYLEDNFAIRTTVRK